MDAEDSDNVNTILTVHVDCLIEVDESVTDVHTQVMDYIAELNDLKDQAIAGAENCEIPDFVPTTRDFSGSDITTTDLPPANPDANISTEYLVDGAMQVSVASKRV